MKKAFLIAGGEVQSEFLSEYLGRRREDDLVIAVDSGLKHLKQISVRPNVILGDFDSADGDLLREYMSDPDIEWIRHNPIKDSTDTELAVLTALESGVDEIDILGGFGGRFDHTLANVYLCFLSKSAKIYMIDARNRMYAIHAKTGETRIYKEKQWGKYISLFPMFGEIQNVSIKGVKYPLQDKTLSLFNEPSLTTSNEIVDEFASILFRGSSILIVESKDGEKGGN